MTTPSRTADAAETMLRYAVVTSRRVGYASRFVEHVAANPSARSELAAVVVCRGVPTAPVLRRIRRVTRKVGRIGVLGAVNGAYMSRWYGRALAERLETRDITDVCRDAGVPAIEIDSFVGDTGRDALRALGVDVAVSMGNGYIPRSFFAIPRHGMINIHHELLPEYRGAQTALWQIHDGSRVSGFTIHTIDDRIDAGEILYRETVPLQIRRTLARTVIESTACIQLRSVEALARLLEDFPGALAGAQPNVGGRLFTTPSAAAMLHVYRQFRRLRAEAGA